MLTFTVVNSNAQAADPPTIGETKIGESATNFYDQGRKATAAKHWAEARSYFIAAWSLQAHWQIAANLGWSEFMLDMHRDAAEHLTYSLQKAPTSVSAAERQELQRMLTTSSAQVGKLAVEATPIAANLFIDGSPIDRTAPRDSLFVTPGTHRVEGRLTGHAPAATSIAIEKGATLPVQLKLIPCNEAREGTEAAAACGLPSGGSGPRGKLPVGLALGGVALAGIAVGVGFTLAANGKANDAASQFAALEMSTPPEYYLCGAGGYPKNATSCATLLDTEKSQDMFQNGAVAGFVAGGVAALGTAAVFLLWPSPKKQMAITVAPSLSLHHKGALLVGTF